MRKFFLISALIIFSSAVHAQRIFWATKVVDYSSQLSPQEYSANQVLGKPNALPQAGNSPTAWLPSKPNKTEYITVEFEKQVRVQQLVIAESFNPTAVYEIYMYDEEGKEHLVHTFDPKPIDLKGRIINVFIDKTDFKVHALKLVLDCSKVPGYNGVDAIAVSPSRKAIEVQIDHPESLQENIQVEKLSSNVNSEFPETRPLIAPDGKTLYFSRENHPENIGGEKDGNDIWYSTMNSKSGEWNTAENIGEPLNNKGPNYISSITPDGKTMVVLLGNEYNKRGKMQPGVSISSKIGDKWESPRRLDIINANIETEDGHYFLANNRRTLLMAVDRFDSHGSKDLYVSFLQDDGKWTEPLNLGNDINTAHTEMSPFLAPDNETLYFSSGGFSGYGGSDVYISRRLDDSWTNWTEPENLGADINTEGNDDFFTIPPSGKFAYFTREGQDENADIHEIQLPIFYQPAPIISMKGKIMDSLRNEPVRARITYKILPEHRDVGFVMSDSVTGEYEILLPAGDAYEYTIEAEGYAPVTRKVDLKEDADYREIDQDMALVPSSGVISPPEADIDTKKVDDFFANREGTLVLEDAVLFDFASEYLKPGAKPYLDHIAKYLKLYKDINMEISGHTDNVGSVAYNLSLSERRAESVKQYLVEENGIEEDRLETTGKGSSQPIASNETEEGQAENRRVEFKIIP